MKLTLHIEEVANNKENNTVNNTVSNTVSNTVGNTGAGVVEEMSIVLDAVSRTTLIEASAIRRILSFCQVSHSGKEIREMLGLTNKSYFSNKYTKPLVREGLLAMTDPENPNNSHQRYYTTEQGKAVLG